MEESTQRLQIDALLDVRGEKPSDCYTKTREALKPLEEGQVLEVEVDEGEVLLTLPYAVKADGHELLISEPCAEGVRFLIRKRASLFAEEEI